MTRIGPAEVTRDPEGCVYVELHGRHLKFSGRREWDEFLFGPDSTRLAYNCLSWSSGYGTAGQPGRAEEIRARAGLG